MSQKIKIAAAQLSPIFMDKSATVQKACVSIAEAAQAGAQLIVFPEAFIPGYPDWVWVVPNSRAAVLNELYLRLVENSVSASDPELDKISEAAAQSGIQVVIGANERNEETSNASLFNSLLFFNEYGQLIGKRRKLIPTAGERTIWARGDGSDLQSYATSVGTIGGLICWENYMPLARMAIYESGAQILVAPTWDKSPRWIQSMQHIAREGGMYVLSTCMAIRTSDIPDAYDFKALYPEGRTWVNSGNSCVIAPDGSIIAGPLEEQEGILYAEIDLDEVIRAKRMFDVVGHYARPDVFEFHLKD